MIVPNLQRASTHCERTKSALPWSPTVLTLCFLWLPLLAKEPATAQSSPAALNLDSRGAAPSEITGERDLTVEQAIDLALANNGEIEIAKLDVRNFEAQKAKARAQYLPTVTNRSAANYLTAREGVVLPPGSLGVFPATGPIPAKTLHVDQGGNLTYSSRTYLNQPTLQLFAIHAMNHAAKMDVDNARLNVEDKSEAIAIQVRQLYYGVLEADAQLRAAEAQVATQKKTEREAAFEVREGSALRVRELQAHANLLQAVSNASKARASSRDQRLQLNNVMGVPLDSRYHLVDGDKPNPDFQVLPPREEAIRVALVQQPQVLMAERKVEKAKAELRVAEDAFIPQLTVSAHESYQVGIALLVRNYGVFQGDFSADLFDGGARRAQVRSERALLAEAKQYLINQQAATRVAVEDAYDNVDTAQADLAAKQQLTVAQREAARVADSRYAQGEILASDRDMAHAQLTEAQAAERQAELQLSLAQSEVRRTLGEIAR